MGCSWPREPICNYHDAPLHDWLNSIELASWLAVSRCEPEAGLGSELAPLVPPAGQDGQVSGARLLARGRANELIRRPAPGQVGRCRSSRAPTNRARAATGDLPTRPQRARRQSCEAIQESAGSAGGDHHRCYCWIGRYQLDKLAPLLATSPRRARTKTECSKSPLFRLGESRTGTASSAD